MIKTSSPLTIVNLSSDFGGGHPMSFSHRAGRGAAARTVTAYANSSFFCQGDEVVACSRRVIWSTWTRWLAHCLLCERTTHFRFRAWLTTVEGIGFHCNRNCVSIRFPLIFKRHALLHVEESITQTIVEGCEGQTTK